MIKRLPLVIVGLFLSNPAFADKLGSLTPQSDIILTTQTVASSGGTTIWIEKDQISVNNTVSTVSFNGVLKSTPITAGRVGAFLNYDTNQFINNSSTFAALSSSFTLLGPNPPASSIAAGNLGTSVLASSFPVSGVNSGSYTNTNLTVNAQGIITSASNGSGGSGSSSGPGGAIQISSDSIFSYNPNLMFSTANASLNISTAVINGTTITYVNSNQRLEIGTHTYVNGVLTSSGGLSGMSTINRGLTVNNGFFNSSGASCTFTVNGANQPLFFVDPVTNSVNVGSITTSAAFTIKTSTNGTAMNILNSSNTAILTVNTVAVGTGTIFSVVDSTGRVSMSVDGAGHVIYASTQPTLSSCGTSPTLSTNSNDTAGTITVGTTATGCTVTFANAFLNKPTCVISNQSMSITSALGYTTSTNQLVVTQAVGLGGDLLDYMCFGH